MRAPHRPGRTKQGKGRTARKNRGEKNQGNQWEPPSRHHPHETPDEHELPRVQRGGEHEAPHADGREQPALKVRRDDRERIATIAAGRVQTILTESLTCAVLTARSRSTRPAARQAARSA